MTKLDRIREFMNRNFDTAQELFVAFKSECSEHQTILCPVQWLYNQNTMRDMWERFRMIKETHGFLILATLTPSLSMGFKGVRPKV